MKGVFNLVLCLFGIISACLAIEVTDKDFEDVVLKSGKTSFVKFYASWCSHCKQLQPTWEQLSKSYKSKDEIQFVEIDGDKNKKYSKVYGIQGFPTLMLFKKDDVNAPITYNGERTVEKLSEFVQKNTGEAPSRMASVSKVVKLNDGNFERLVMKNKKSAFILFSGENCTTCKSLEKDWDKLADAFHLELEKVIVGMVYKESDEPIDWMTKMFNVTEYPSIVFISKGDVDHPNVYGDSTSVKEMISFLNKKLDTDRALGGGLAADAGIIREVSDYMVAFLKADTITRNHIAGQVIASLRGLNPTKYKDELKYYARLITLMLTEEPANVLSVEKQRLSKAKEDPDLDNAVYDGIDKRINMVGYCEDILNGKVTATSQVITSTEVSSSETTATTEKEELKKDEL